MGLLDLIGHKYPSTNFHELNLDWCITAILQLQKAFEDFSAGNKLIFADPLQHDLTKTYAKNTIVVDPVSGTAYLSLDVVPKGVQLSNASYWLPVFDFAGYVTRANQNFTDNYFSGTDRTPIALAAGDWVVLDDVLYKVTAAMAADDLFEIGTNIDHFTVEQFLKDFITAINATVQQYKNDIDASELLYRQQLALDIANTTASLQAQLDAAISGATVDSEVINARVAADGETYPTLGDAIRSQVLNIKGDISILTNSIFNIPFEVGNVSATTGEELADNYRMRSKYIKFVENVLSVHHTSSDWGYLLVEFSAPEESAFVGAITFYRYNDFQQEINPEHYYRIVVKRADDGSCVGLQPDIEFGNNRDMNSVLGALDDECDSLYGDFDIKTIIGNVSYLTGEDLGSTTRRRTPYIKFKTDRVIIENHAPWQSLVIANSARSANNVVSAATDNNYHGGRRIINVNPDYYYRIVFRKSDDSSCEGLTPDVSIINANNLNFLGDSARDAGWYDVPDYLKSMLDSKITSILNKAKSNCIVMPIYSDAHIDNADNVRYQSMLSCFNYINKRVAFDGIISLGDEINYTIGRVDHASNDEIFSLISSWHCHSNERQKAPLLTINGNHDGVGTDFFSIPWWIACARQNDYHPSIHCKGDKPYFYVDFPNKRVRLIFMSIPYDSQLGVEHPTPYWEAGDDQLDWLANTALNTYDGCNVMLFVHTPTCCDYGEPTSDYNTAVWDGSQVRYVNVLTLMGRCADKASIEGVFNAYKNKTSYTDAHVSCDYSNLTSTNVIAEYAGHVHCDITIDAGQVGDGGLTNNMPCKVFTIAPACDALGGSFPNFTGGVIPARSNGTSTEVLFDVMILNMTNGICDFVRIGAGSDRQFTF